MFLSKPALVAVVGYASGIAAHGIVKELEASGESMGGYQPHAWTKEPTAGWSIPKDQDHGFLDPSNYEDPDIICHVGATPGALSLTVAAGESVGLQWTSWPISHHGNVVNYLANCNGKCEDADKTKLQFNKVDERGLVHPNPDYPIGEYIDDVTTGWWAGDELRDNGNKAWFTVPGWLAAGNYVLRHELMALHNAMPEGKGIQHYPQCINLIVTGGGSDSLESGTLGTELYRRDQPGVFINIFRNPGEYTVPGPEVYKPGNGKAAPKKSSATPAKTSAAPKQEYSFAPLGDSSVAPEKTSAAPERTPEPQVTPSRGVYQNTTIASSLPQKTKVPESNKHASYDYTGSEAIENGDGSVPAVGNNGESNSGKNQPEESSSASSNYDYDLSKDVKSSSDGNTGGSADNVLKESSPDTNNYVASNVKAAESSDTAKDPALDPSIISLFDLIQKTLDELRKKLLGRSTHKRHVRDLER